MAVRRVTWCGEEGGHPAHNAPGWDGFHCPGGFCKVEGCEGSPSHFGRHGGVRSLRDDPLAGWAKPPQSGPPEAVDCG